MISIQMARTQRAQPTPEPRAGQAAARLLVMLQHNRSAGLTIAAMRERGIEAPAQAIYALQLAGYEIDRVPLPRPDGHMMAGYRLGGRPPQVLDEPAHEVEDDPI